MHDILPARRRLTLFPCGNLIRKRHEHHTETPGCAFPPAGAIIWLVNYGTTDGVDNPLLTATKKAFLDPDAVEPDPYPNPLPPAPVPAVSVSFAKAKDRGSGWCGSMTVKNVGEVAGWFVAETDFPDTVIALWNGTYTLDSGTVRLQAADRNPDLAPEATNNDPGFCASR